MIWGIFISIALTATRQSYDRLSMTSTISASASSNVLPNFMRGRMKPHDKEKHNRQSRAEGSGALSARVNDDDLNGANAYEPSTTDKVQWGSLV